MSAPRYEPVAGAGVHVPRRAPIAPSLFIDGALGAGAYLISYWLRFPGERLATFLPRAVSTLPFAVACQLFALVAVQAYAPNIPRVKWFLRVSVGILVGSAAAAVLVGVALGFEGVSRFAFAADGLIFTLLAFSWRGVWALRARARARSAVHVRIDGLIDRAAELTTLRATVAGLYAYRQLLKTLVLKDLKLKYRGSVFGFVWSLANPLLTIVVYAMAFTFILRVGREGFIFYLMLGQLSWSFFASSATMSTGSIVDNGGLLKSVFFPRAILTIGTVLFNFAQYLLTAVVFLPVMLVWYHVPLSAPMLLYPVFLALQVVFTIGIALILATTTAFFRDVRHLLEVTLSILFWMTPIIYELGQVPERMRLLILLAPLSPFVVAYQKVFFFREWPDLTVFVLAAVYAFGAFIVGIMLHLEFEDQLTEQL
jgi:ABC-2 type transport system permease protein